MESRIMAPRDYNPADYDEWLWQQADLRKTMNG